MYHFTLGSGDPTVLVNGLDFVSPELSYTLSMMVNEREI